MIGNGNVLLFFNLFFSIFDLIVFGILYLFSMLVSDEVYLSLPFILFEKSGK